MHTGQRFWDDTFGSRTHFAFLRLETVFEQERIIDRFRRRFCTLQTGEALDILQQLFGRHVLAAEQLPPHRLFCPTVEVEQLEGQYPDLILVAQCAFLGRQASEQSITIICQQNLDLLLLCYGFLALSMLYDKSLEAQRTYVCKPVA
ncbi:hypothetical protein D3C79_751190 [compost metagenome]